MRLSRIAPLATALLAACGGALPPDGASADDIIYSSRVHKMPRNASPTTTSAPAGAHLTYYGGRVISNVEVVEVLWGSGSYLPEVTSTATPSMATFYQQVTNSAYFDWLTEYNTPTGSHQQIGHGHFKQQVQITPSAANNGATIDDSAIQAELAAQIAAGKLPAPTFDAGGNNNTYYAIFFPHGKTITQGGNASCSYFCAYHGTFVRNGKSLYYGVHPDMQAGSGCENGCGSAPSAFDNYTSVASHELVEATTDAEVGLATTNGPPLAWYDNTNGEIGDICNAQQGTITGADGHAYTVQQEFSNVANDCITTRSTTAQDFTVAVSPSSVSVAAGSSASASITTAETSGAAQTIALAASGAPAGVTVSISPTSVTAGGNAAVTVAASSSAAAGTYSITITGTAPSGSHSAALSVTVSGGTTGGGSGITNGGFESGLTGWTTTGTATVASSGCHGGSKCAQLGSSSPTNGDSTAAQTFTAPSGSTTISLWYKETCPDTVTYDWALVTLKDNTAGTTATLVAKTCQTNAWTQATGAVTAGHSYTLTLTSHDDNYAGDATYTAYDDVTLSGGTTGGGSGITNGGFEAGSYSGWTTAGTAAVVSGGHSGSYAARLGSTSPTNGDSTASQTFTVPAGKSQLSLWYKMSCPDSLTYDWATVTLKNTSSGATTTVLPRTCSTNSSWVNVTAAVTAGARYTLTLTSHDDNYASDPTYTLFDDATLN